MTDEQHENIVVEKVNSHRLGTMIAGSIVTSLVLVMIALSLYSSSGAEQLDLSRPGLADVREQAVQDDGTYAGFNATGPLDDHALNEFAKMYEEKLDEAESIDAFGADVLSPKALEIDHDSALQVVAP